MVDGPWPQQEMRMLAETMPTTRLRSRDMNDYVARMARAAVIASFTSRLADA